MPAPATLPTTRACASSATRCFDSTPIPSSWKITSRPRTGNTSGSAISISPPPPVVLEYKGRELVVIGGKEGVLYLMDAENMGGLTHHDNLYTTPLLSNDDEWFEAKGLWGGFSSYVDARGKVWVYAPTWGPMSAQAPDFPIVNGPNPNGSAMAFTVADHPESGKPYLKPEWVSAATPPCRSPSPSPTTWRSCCRTARTPGSRSTRASCLSGNSTPKNCSRTRSASSTKTKPGCARSTPKPGRRSTIPVRTPSRPGAISPASPSPTADLCSRFLIHAVLLRAAGRVRPRRLRGRWRVESKTAARAGKNPYRLPALSSPRRPRHCRRGLPALLLCAWIAAFPAAAQTAGDAAARGVRLQQQGDLRGAMAAYEQALELAPGRLDALSNLAMVYLHLGPAGRRAPRPAARPRGGPPSTSEWPIPLGLAYFQTGRPRGPQSRNSPGLSPDSQPIRRRCTYMPCAC